MKKALRRANPLLWLWLMVAVWLLSASMYGENSVMGEIQFEGKSHVEKTSGVWVDGGYVGYLSELKGSKKVLLLPGEHVITVRQDGYQDFTQHIRVEPGEKQVVHVAMERALTGPLPAAMATLKISVNPSRAAVFLDNLFVGHVGEFEGVGRGLLVAPGEHRIKIALPGYQAFETEVSPLANQNVEIKTNLLKDNLTNGEAPVPVASR
ncbi:MAG: PEGA domain-containing protein [Candidatus Sulfotelmatobacter sp.]